MRKVRSRSFSRERWFVAARSASAVIAAMSATLSANSDVMTGGCTTVTSTMRPLVARARAMDSVITASDADEKSTAARIVFMDQLNAIASDCQGTLKLCERA